MALKRTLSSNAEAEASTSSPPAKRQAKEADVAATLEEPDFDADVEAAIQEAEEKARLEVDVGVAEAQTSGTSTSKPTDGKTAATKGKEGANKFTEPDDVLAFERRTMDNRWFDRLKGEMETVNFKKLKAFLASEAAARKTIFPPSDQIYRWSTLTPPDRVKVVILGQDPYHTPKMANGLAFSVDRKCSIPPSLRNIYKELDASYPDFKIPKHGCLDGWAAQGVLLLNASLTVQSGQAGSHSKHGWEQFTRAVLRAIADDAAAGVGIKPSSSGGSLSKQAEKAAVKNSAIASMFRKVEKKKAQPEAEAAESKSGEPSSSATSTGSDGKKGGVVFFAWGAFAAKALADAGITDASPNVLILRSVHPSPLSAQRGFFRAAADGAKQESHFVTCNKWLEKPGHHGPGQGINWGDL